MTLTIEYILLAASGLLLLSIITSKVSGRWGVPALLFLLIGMLAGSDGPGGIHFDDHWRAQSLRVVALALLTGSPQDDFLLAFTGQQSFLRLRSILDRRHPTSPKEPPDHRGIEVVS